MSEPNASTQSEIKRRLIDGLAEFMLDDDGTPNPECGYSAADVDRCRRIVDDYLQAIGQAPPADEAILPIVEHAVLQLNQLNAAVDSSLIETDQREDLCELILSAARRAGLSATGDVTEAWREW